MTKSLLALVCAAAALSGSAETPSVNFTYAQQHANTYTLGLAKGVEVSLAFGLYEDMTEVFGGNEITAVKSPPAHIP